MTLAARPLRASNRRNVSRRPWATLEPLEHRTLLTALVAPVITAPGNTTYPGPMLTTSTPTFQWNSITASGMTGYQLNVYDWTRSKGNTYTISPAATSFTVPAALNAGDTYVWNLRLVAGTASGPPSTYFFFRAPPAPVLPAPVTTAPGNATYPGPTLTTSTPTFQWNPVTASGMTGYQLNLYDWTRSKGTSYSVSPSATSFTLPAGALTAGDSYVWNLRIVVGTVTGPPSTYFFFRAPPAPPLPAPVITALGATLSPGPVLTTSTPTFQWNPVTAPGMTAYQLNLFDVTRSTGKSYSLAPSATSFTLPTGALTLGDSYIWNLRIVVGTVTGPPSTYFFFRAPPVPAPVIISPGNTTSAGTVVTTLTPTFQWNPITSVPGMTGYQLNLYDETLGKFTSYRAPADATEFTLRAGVLTAGDNYLWNLRLVIGTATGPESAYFHFHVQ